MTGDDKVRHCHKCKFNVYNLSAMTEVEAESLLQLNADKSLCVRFFRRLDGKIMTAACPLGAKVLDSTRPWSLFVWQSLAAIMSLVAAAAVGQGLRSGVMTLETAISQSYSTVTTQLSSGRMGYYPSSDSVD
ncbi:MAG: hypothetical protein K2W95_09935 [Candidatus Obscuribacterales bacterium]|nr:hypothetical protein [Candidatus Obscuribacterales bacterium]